MIIDQYWFNGEVFSLYYLCKKVSCKWWKRKTMTYLKMTKSLWSIFLIYLSNTLKSLSLSVMNYQCSPNCLTVIYQYLILLSYLCDLFLIKLISFLPVDAKAAFLSLAFEEGFTGSSLWQDVFTDRQLEVMEYCTDLKVRDILMIEVRKITEMQLNIQLTHCGIALPIWSHHSTWSTLVHEPVCWLRITEVLCGIHMRAMSL